jgi:hypothetical protein
LIKGLVLRIGQSIRDPTPQLPLCVGSHRAAQPFDGRKRRADDAPRPQFLK